MPSCKDKEQPRIVKPMLPRMKFNDEASIDVFELHDTVGGCRHSILSIVEISGSQLQVGRHPPKPGLRPCARIHSISAPTDVVTGQGVRNNGKVRAVELAFRGLEKRLSIRGGPAKALHLC